MQSSSAAKRVIGAVRFITAVAQFVRHKMPDEPGFHVTFCRQTASDCQRVDAALYLVGRLINKVTRIEATAAIAALEKLDV